MPVYLRNHLTPPSVSELQDDHDDMDDFLQDPEQLWDVLPQPYRMIDKVINNVLDNSWAVISSREKDRIAEASRIRPPQYACTTQAQEHGEAQCLCESPDGFCIFIGLQDGLAAIDGVTQSTLDVWTDEEMSITQIHVSILESNIYLICTVDGTGVGRIFSLAGCRLFLIQVTNEVQNGETLTVATKMEGSMDGSYVGVYYENISNREGFLEIHKTPQDTWLKELEGILAKTSPKKQIATSPPITEGEGTQSPGANGAPVGEVEGEAATGVPPSSGEERNAKFAATSLVLKVKPTPPVQGNLSGSQLTVSKSADLGDVIGTGTNHLISPQHLEARESMFDHQHHQHLKYLPREEKPPFRQPYFHFMTPGRMMPQGLENPLHANGTTTVAVWWTGSHHLLHYSILKSGKVVEEDPLNMGKNVKKAKKQGIVTEGEQLEAHKRGRQAQSSLSVRTPRRQSAMGSRRSVISDRSDRTNLSSLDIHHYPDQKPDMVWPMSHKIVASALTPCSSLLALALSDGSVVIWDKQLGMERRIVHLTDESEITSVTFLDPSVCPQETINYPPYTTHVNVYLLVTCSDSQMFLVDCHLNSQTPPVHVTQAIENKDERYSYIRTIAGVTNFVLACRQDGIIFLINLLNGRVIGEITLPKGYRLTSPWQPVTAVGGSGQTVYIKAELNTAKEERSEELESSFDGRSAALCVFNLQQCYALDHCRTKRPAPLPFTIHSVVQNRVDALFAERLSQQALRKDRMQARWGQMKSDLELMIQLRQEAAKNSQNNVAYAS